MRKAKISNIVDIVQRLAKVESTNKYLDGIIIGLFKAIGIPMITLTLNLQSLINHFREVKKSGGLKSPPLNSPQ